MLGQSEKQKIISDCPFVRFWGIVGCFGQSENKNHKLELPGSIRKASGDEKNCIQEECHKCSVYREDVDREEKRGIRNGDLLMRRGEGAIIFLKKVHTTPKKKEYVSNILS